MKQTSPASNVPVPHAAAVAVDEDPSGRHRVEGIRRRSPDDVGSRRQRAQLRGRRELLAAEPPDPRGQRQALEDRETVEEGLRTLAAERAQAPEARAAGDAGGDRGSPKDERDVRSEGEEMSAEASNAPMSI